MAAAALTGEALHEGSDRRIGPFAKRRQVGFAKLSAVAASQALDVDAIAETG
jgi:hypothetical protein